jgi:hypothetical protein
MAAWFVPVLRPSPPRRPLPGLNPSTPPTHSSAHPPGAPCKNRGSGTQLSIAHSWGISLAHKNIPRGFPFLSTDVLSSDCSRESLGTSYRQDCPPPEWLLCFVVCPQCFQGAWSSSLRSQRMPGSAHLDDWIAGELLTRCAWVGGDGVDSVDAARPETPSCIVVPPPRHTSGSALHKSAHPVGSW